MKLKHLENEYSLANEIDYTFHDNLSAMNIAFIQLELHEENSITYIAGWACSKLNHLECLDKLATNYKNNISIVAENTFISMKEYDECNLLYPFISTIIFVSKKICLFNNNINSLLKKK